MEESLTSVTLVSRRVSFALGTGKEGMEAGKPGGREMW